MASKIEKGTLEQENLVIAEKNSAICRKLCKRRMDMGMSQKDLAILSGNTLKNIESMENGDVIISYRIAAGIARILGTTVEKL